MRLKDKVAIITGAGAGIGEAIAVRFAEEGARLVLNDITEKAAQRAVDLIRKMGVEAVSAVGDISNETDAARLTQVALDTYGRLNILVNNAANFTQKSVEDATVADWEKVLKVNVIGTALVAKYAARAMVAAGAGGSIVNIGSMSGIVAQHNFATYNSSKGAVLTMTRCMALDLAPHNIRVNTVCPGCILTSASHREIERLGLTFGEWRDRVAPGHMLNRLGEPREVANAVLFLASDEASFITAEELLVDGGFIHW
jgi:NAD(P)-dependent dehydrogenase (short-subunit alcohol dehydrogenase family)